jgi:hypothetical protein
LTKKYRKEKMSTMKTTIILATLLMLNASLIFANLPMHKSAKAEPLKIEMTISFEKFPLIPPVLADFSDGTEHSATVEIMITKLAPITPVVADFDDETSAPGIDILRIAPETPKESDFEDANFVDQVTTVMLAPATPTEADFTN